MEILINSKDLTLSIKENLPLKALPAKELTKIFRESGHPITSKTELTITNVLNTGDTSGIMCIVGLENGYKTACPLTHLVFSSRTSLHRNIIDYQKEREKRVEELNKLGKD